MRVVQINSVCDQGSTGRLCREISEMLTNQNIENYILYGIGRSDFDNSIKFSKDIYVKMNILKTRILGNHAFYSHIATMRLIHHLDIIKPTIIHLHQIHGHYLNIKMLITYIKNKEIPLIITLHDCWVLTGHCTHFSRIKCERWLIGCGECPQQKEYPVSWFVDRSNSNWKRKKQLFENLDNVTFICVSTWLESLVRKSYLRKHEVCTIYNGVDIQTFKLRTRRHNDKFIILGMAGKWFDKENIVASTYFIDEAGKRENIEIWLIGTDKTFQQHYVKSINYINNPEKLAEYYSDVDVFVNLSHEDSFGLVSAEALACGTPVVCYNATALPEVIGENGKCGYYVKDYDYVEMWEKIMEIRFKGKEYYSKQCRNRIEEQFDKSDMCRKILKLYKKKEK